jgi:hypothetical protein
MSTILNLIVGALIKIISTGAGKYFEFKREKELAILNAQKDTIVALQSGDDKADPWTRFTRRILALLMVGVWCYIMYYIVVVNPDIQYEIVTSKKFSWLWSWLLPFGLTDKGTMLVSAGGLLWEFKTLVEIITGFYFTKVGK